MINDEMRVAPQIVYDFLKVIWSDFETINDIDSLAIISCTLTDPGCVRWMSENMAFGDKQMLSSLERKYGWQVGDDLPEWLTETKHRLLLVKELLVRVN